MMVLGWLSQTTIFTLSLLVVVNAQSLELVFIGRASDSNHITLECRQQQNSSPVTSPLFWVERSDLPRQLVNSESSQNGRITFVITQGLEGMHFCSNSNIDIFSNRLDLVAYPQPNFDIPSSFIFEVGQPATINCRIMPGKLGRYYSVSWMSGSLTIATSNPQSMLPGYQLHGNFSLTIQDIQTSDSNSSYVCMVTIFDPQTSVDKVYGQSELGSYTVMVYVPPSVETPVEPRVVANEQQLATFICHATGIPLPQISWMHNGRNISRHGGERFQSGIIEISGNSIQSRLNATQLGVTDSGSIECVAQSIVDIPNGQPLVLHAISRTTLTVLTDHYHVAIRVAVTGDLVFQINFNDDFRVLEQMRLLMKFTDADSMVTRNITSLQAFVNASIICLEVPQSSVPFQRSRVQVALKVGDEVGQFLPSDDSHVYDVRERNEETKRTGIIAGSVVGAVILIACVLSLLIPCACIIRSHMRTRTLNHELEMNQRAQNHELEVNQRAQNHELEVNQRAQNHELEMNQNNQIGAAAKVLIDKGTEPTEFKEYLDALSEAIKSKVTRTAEDGEDKEDEQEKQKRKFFIDFINGLPRV